MAKLIHHGSTIFNKFKVLPIKNVVGWRKPEGGLWTSPIDSKYGWEHWCWDNDYMACSKGNSFTIELKSTAKVLVINTYEDLDKLPTQSIINRSTRAPLIKDLASYPDFEEIAKSYDAIHLTVMGQELTRFSHPKNLYGWDCESVLILNINCILNT